MTDLDDDYVDYLDLYLMPSPYASDGGHLIGRLPHTVPLKALRALGGAEVRGKAIREKCIDCSGGSPTEVRKCAVFKCALWPFRMGRSPFLGRHHHDEETDHSEDTIET